MPCDASVAVGNTANFQCLFLLPLNGSKQAVAKWCVPPEENAMLKKYLYVEKHPWMASNCVTGLKQTKCINAITDKQTQCLWV